MRAAGIVVACLALAIATGCGSSAGYAPTNLQTVQPPPKTVAGSPATAKVHADAVVTLRNIAFSPATVNVRVGQTVEWINSDSIVHNVTSLNGSTIASPTLGGGQRFAFTPRAPGVIRYYCTIHSSAMTGQIVVTK